MQTAAKIIRKVVKKYEEKDKNRNISLWDLNYSLDLDQVLQYHQDVRSTFP